MVYTRKIAKDFMLTCTKKHMCISCCFYTHDDHNRDNDLHHTTFVVKFGLCFDGLSTNEANGIPTNETKTSQCVFGRLD